MPTPANALNISTSGLKFFDGTGTFTSRTITGTANQITVTNGDGSAGSPTLSLPSALQVSGVSFDSGTTTLSTLVNAAAATGMSLAGTVTAGTPSISTATGWYAQLGKLVIFGFNITGTLTGSAGNILITNLPIAVGTITGYTGGFWGSFARNGTTFAMTTNYSQGLLYTDSTTGGIQLWEAGSAQTLQGVPTTTTAISLFGTIVYSA